MLKSKNILLGVTGGIAAYKAAELASLLVKQHANVDVIMTKNATKFIAPLTFEAITGRMVYTDTFDDCDGGVAHIQIADRTDLVIIAPATANIIAKLANGIADDMLTTTVLACTCKKLISPAMNTNMYNNPVTQSNINKLKNIYNWTVITPASGRLACGAEGIGKLPQPSIILDSILLNSMNPHDLEGKTVLITAGPTQESIDPVRFITNHSSGKMGYALAKMAAIRGANVVLISGEVGIRHSLDGYNNISIIDIKSAEDLFNAVKNNIMICDYLFMAAAVADYTPIEYSDNKVKKSDNDLSIKLKRTVDILKYISCSVRDDQVICGFSMETENMLANSQKKLQSKHLDMICANNLKVDGAGFGTDTNVMTLITSTSVEELPIMSKEDVANIIIDRAISLEKNK